MMEVDVLSFIDRAGEVIYNRLEMSELLPDEDFMQKDYTALLNLLYAGRQLIERAGKVSGALTATQDVWMPYVLAACVILGEDPVAFRVVKA
jgi:hypothetical protein